MNFNTVEEALEDLRQGKVIIVVDDPERENEGDFVVASEKVTPEAINLMAKKGGGLICVTMTRERFKELRLEVPSENTSKFGTPFGIPIDAKETSTGASAYDRALTARWVADPTKGERDFLKPGHLYTLRAEEGGVLVRAGHTEASVDLCKLAGLYPSAVICEILDDDGKMARLPKLFEISRELGIKIISIAQIIEYRLRNEILVERVWEGEMENSHGKFRAIIYRDKVKGEHHMALVKGEIGEEVFVRVQTHCVAGNVFRAKSCKCGDNLEKSLNFISKNGGVFVYIRKGEPGIFPFLHLMGIEEEEQTLREYGIGMQILKDLGVRSAKLLVSKMKILPAIEGFGIKITGQVFLDE
jgi:3,4-dihydroxy 2-butanone 4-phosphate synthase/GTP cyclohydrolase II